MTDFRKDIEDGYHELTKNLIGSGLSVSVMESCTGGLVAALFSDVEGASEVFENGLVTYSNSSKISYGLDEDIIKKYGVYSEQRNRDFSANSRKSAVLPT